MAALTNSSTAADIMNALNDIAAVNNRSDLVNLINTIDTNGDTVIKTSITNVVGAPALSTDTWLNIASDIQTSKNTLATNLGTLGISANGTTDTLATLAGKVTKDANLVTGNIISGKTIYGVAGKSSVVDTASANATAAQILSGQTGYVNGSLVTGSMANYISTNQLGGSPWISGTSLYFPVNNGGYYPGAGASGVYQTDSNFVASNIANGVSIFGLTGTYAGPSNIKSIQRGTTSIGSGVTSITATISSVDTTKAIVIGPTGTSNSVDLVAFFSASLTNATTLTFTRVGNSSVTTISWQVIEFNNVKSKQAGIFSTINSIDTVTVTSVNTSKAILFVSAEDGAGNYASYRGDITNATTLTFNYDSNGYNRKVSWQLIEFN